MKFLALFDCVKSGNVDPENQKEEREWRNKVLATIPLRTFFQYTYYSGIVPVKFMINDTRETDARYTKKTCLCQQIICATLHALFFLDLLTQIRGSFDTTSRTEIIKKPSVLFGIICNVCSFIYKLSFMKAVWCYDHKIEEVLNKLLASKHLPLSGLKVTEPLIQHLLFILVAIYPVVCIITGIGFVKPIYSLSPSWWLRRLVARARYGFGLHALYKSDTAPEIEDLTMSDAFITALMAGARYSRYMLTIYPDLLILIFAFTLWNPSNALECQVKSNVMTSAHQPKHALVGKEKSKRVLTAIIKKGRNHTRTNFLKRKQWKANYMQFKAIQELGKMINGALGAKVLWYLLEGIFHYSIHFAALFDPDTDFLETIITALFMSIIYCILHVSADVCAKVQSIKSWQTTEGSFRPPMKDMQHVLDALSSNDIGIQGNNMFTITFPVAGSFIGTIITYFLICSEPD